MHGVHQITFEQLSTISRRWCLVAQMKWMTMQTISIIHTIDLSSIHIKLLFSQDNYKENLGTLIRTIYDFAFVT